MESIKLNGFNNGRDTTDGIGAREGFNIEEENQSTIIPSLLVTWKDDNEDWWETLEINNEIIGHRRLPKLR